MSAVYSPAAVTATVTAASSIAANAPSAYLGCKITGHVRRRPCPVRLQPTLYTLYIYYIANTIYVLSIYFLFSYLSYKCV